MTGQIVCDMVAGVAGRRGKFGEQGKALAARRTSSQATKGRRSLGQATCATQNTARNKAVWVPRFPGAFQVTRDTRHKRGQPVG